jgi:hypothetical protein
VLTVIRVLFHMHSHLHRVLGERNIRGIAYFGALWSIVLLQIFWLIHLYLANLDGGTG